jgi:hypothetical protein
LLSLFALMIAGYALEVVAAVLMPQGRAGRSLVATGAVLGGGAGLALGLQVLLTGVPFGLDALLKNIVPGFPLCNKSFNQSYSGNDL